MAKITRANQVVFASTAGASGVAEPGSTADGSTVFTTDPATIQSAAYLEGLAAMIIAGVKRLPVYEEINALYYLFSRQLAYLFQEGIPEWNTDAVYYNASIVKKTGTYELYGSIGNDNQGNALPLAVSDANWTYLGTLSSLASAGNVSTAETSSLDGQMYVASGTGGKTLKKVSSSGYPKLSSGVPAFSSTIPLTDLATQAANSVVINATGSSAAPTALTLSASTVLGRDASNNAAALTLNGLTAASGVLSVNGRVRTSTTTYATSTALSSNIPQDDTIPQSGEGTQILSLAFTPQNASSTLLIRWEIYAYANIAMIMAPLFVAGTADALQTASGYSGSSSSNPICISGEYSVSAGSTSPRTYNVNLGANTGNVYANGGSGGRLFGGSSVCRLTIEEIFP